MKKRPAASQIFTLLHHTREEVKHAGDEPIGGGRNRLKRKGGGWGVKERGAGIVLKGERGRGSF